MSGTQKQQGDAISRALLLQRPELAGRVHLVNGRPWCDGVNHTTMCDPAFAAEPEPYGPSFGSSI